jgi:hypothetical protein
MLRHALHLAAVRRRIATSTAEMTATNDQANHA